MTYFRCWLLVVLCLGGSLVAASSGTGRPIDPGVPSLPPSPQQVESLVLLGRVWGFAKYYHPAATTGRVDWDYELRTLYPQVLACRTPLERSQLLGRWLTSLGPVPACLSCAPVHATARLQPALG